MPKVLEGTARELILNIKKFCESEKKSKALLIPLRNVRARVAALAGVSEKTVSRIVKEGQIAATTSSRLVTPGKRRPHPKKIIVTQTDLNFIRQKIHHYYVANKEMPSVNKLRLELNTDINFQGSNTTLRRILKGIGFKFKSPQSKSGLPPGLSEAKPIKRKKTLKKDSTIPTPPETSNETFTEAKINSYQNLSNVSHLYPQQPTFTMMQLPPPMHPVANINMQNINIQSMQNMQTVQREIHML